MVLSCLAPVRWKCCRMYLPVGSEVFSSKNNFHTRNRDVERRCCGTGVDRLCCCDDKGHAGCVVGSTAVSGEASGVDVTHKEVNGDTAGRRPEERRDNNECESSTDAHTVYICAVV